MTEVILQVKGMMCGHCKAAVERALKNLSGVESALADPDKGSVIVRFDPAAAAPERFRDAIEEIGYEVVL